MRSKVPNNWLGSVSVSSGVSDSTICSDFKLIDDNHQRNPLTVQDFVILGSGVSKVNYNFPDQPPGSRCILYTYPPGGIYLGRERRAISTIFINFDNDWILKKRDNIICTNVVHFHGNVKWTTIFDVGINHVDDAVMSIHSV